MDEAPQTSGWGGGSQLLLQNSANLRFHGASMLRRAYPQLSVHFIIKSANGQISHDFTSVLSMLAL